LITTPKTICVLCVVLAAEDNLEHTNTPNFPGGIDPTDYTSNSNNNRIAGVGIDWTVRPDADQSVHAGYMYQYSAFSQGQQVSI